MRRKIETKKISKLPSWPLLPSLFRVRRSRTHFGSFFTQVLYFHASLGWETRKLDLKNRRKGVSKKISTWKSSEEKNWSPSTHPNLPFLLGEKALTVLWKNRKTVERTDQNFRPLSRPRNLPLDCTEDSFVDLRNSSKLTIAYSYFYDRTKMNNFPMFLGFPPITRKSFMKIESLVEEL